MSGSPRILFVVDAGANVGSGHVTRCLTLAGALQSMGAACTFASPPAVDEVLALFAPAAVSAPAGGADPEALFIAAQNCPFDAMVFDHGGLGEADHRAMARGRPVLVIDDLADRPLGADLLLNPNPERRRDDYDGLLSAEARLLLGPLHALVRPEFPPLRETAMAKREAPVRRVLIAMDAAGSEAALGKVLDRLRLRVGEAELDVAIDHAAPGRAGLERLARRDPRIHLHVDEPDMARLTLEADLAVGVPGSSAWERCALGLPTVLVIATPSQRPSAHALAELEAALVVDLDAPDFEPALDRALARLVRDPELRRSLAVASARICDGQGAGRVAQALLKLIRDTTPQAESVAG